MFYKTRNGARVGDMFMSLIYTCELNGANAFEYLNQLQLHAVDVVKLPDRWLPWPDLAGSLKPSRTLLARTLRQEE